MSQKSGNIVAIEVLENELLVVFYLLRKKKYYNLCLNQIEKRYGDIEYRNLYEIRVNSICYYNHNNANNMHSLYVLDELIENINMWMKMLPLESDQESWIHHSPNVIFTRKAHMFVHNEYR